MEATASQMPLTGETPAAVTQPGVFRRIGNMASNVWEAATSHPKELLATGLAAYACAQAAELTFESNPVLAKAENTPGAIAQSSSLEQECKQKLLKLPTVLNEEGNHRTEMFKPGKLGQVTVVSVEYAPSDPKCSRFTRIGKAIVELANPKHHNQLTDIGEFTYSGKQDFISGGALAENSHDPNDDYKCTPGAGKTPVWLHLLNVVKKGKQVIGQKDKKVKMQVEGGGC